MPVTITRKDAGPYAAVIADLERQRDELDKLIESLRAHAGLSKAVDNPRIDQPSPTPTVVHPAKGEFTGMTFVDAAKKLLAREGKPMSNLEIFEGLAQGGLRTASAEPLNTIGSMLNREYQKNGSIVRVGRGTWTLPNLLVSVGTEFVGRQPMDLIAPAGPTEIPVSASKAWQAITKK